MKRVREPILESPELPLGDIVPNEIIGHILSFALPLDRLRYAATSRASYRLVFGLKLLSPDLLRYPDGDFRQPWDGASIWRVDFIFIWCACREEIDDLIITASPRDYAAIVRYVYEGPFWMRKRIVAEALARSAVRVFLLPTSEEPRSRLEAMILRDMPRDFLKDVNDLHKVRLRCDPLTWAVLLYVPEAISILQANAQQANKLHKDMWECLITNTLFSRATHFCMGTEIEIDAALMAPGPLEYLRRGLRQKSAWGALIPGIVWRLLRKREMSVAMVRAFCNEARATRLNGDMHKCLPFREHASECAANSDPATMREKLAVLAQDFTPTELAVFPFIWSSDDSAITATVRFAGSGLSGVSDGFLTGVAAAILRLAKPAWFVDLLEPDAVAVLSHISDESRFVVDAITHSEFPMERGLLNQYRRLLARFRAMSCPERQALADARVYHTVFLRFIDSHFPPIVSSFLKALIEHPQRPVPDFLFKE